MEVAQNVEELKDIPAIECLDTKEWKQKLLDFDMDRARGGIETLEYVLKLKSDYIYQKFSVIEPFYKELMSIKWKLGHMVKEKQDID